MFDDGEKRCLDCRYYRIEKDIIFNFNRYFCKDKKTDKFPAAFTCKDFIEKVKSDNP